MDDPLQNPTLLCFVYSQSTRGRLVLADDHRSTTDILNAPEHGGVTREAPAVGGDVQQLSFVTVQPAGENVDRALFHKIDIEDRLRRFLIEDLEPCRIGEEGQGRARFEFKPGFKIEGP
jgi:hypothetical protein